MAFALQLLAQVPMAKIPWHSDQHLQDLALVMALTNRARLDAHCDTDGLKELLGPALVQTYQREIRGRSACLSGTTHISVMDAAGNSAAMTVSNGEGCGKILPGTGIMLNNVLGEEDINPEGFQRWQTNQRMTSMMTPSLIEMPDGWTALGSGGSNRIRTALLQVISNLVDFQMSPQAAVDSPRLHLEQQQLDIETVTAPQTPLDLPHGGLEESALAAEYPGYKRWPERNLFFGGVHLVRQQQGRFDGAGDPRRGGLVKIVH